MGKKSATKVEAAPAAIKATKPLKKGKRETEDDLDTKVNLKKQKKDLVAAVQKEKTEKKVPKKVESSDEESDSEVEDKEEVAATKKPAVAKPVVKDSSSSEEEGSEEESEDEKPVAKKAAPAATKATSSSDSSEEEEDSDDESEDEKPAPKETKTDGSGSDESESEDEEETPKKKSSDVEMVDTEKTQPKTPSTPATGGTKTLFVANLPFQVERSDVEEFFKEAGQVVDVRFAMSKDDGRFRGFGHVEFASAAEAQKALEFNGRPLLGRELRLDVAEQRGERPAYTPQSGAGNFRSGGGGAEVFVKGFDPSLPVNDIKSALSKHFSSCGEITRVSVPVDRETGGSRGIAYVEFKEGTDKAFELNGSDMGGWNIVVDEPRPKENNNSGGFNSGRSSYGGGRDNGRGRSRGRGRDNFRGRGRGRENGRGRPSFTRSEGTKTTFSDE